MTNTKSAPVVHQWPRTDYRYWKDRLVKRTYKKPDGTVAEVGHYSFQVSHDGHRQWIATSTADATKAARMASEFWVALRAGGWSAARARFGLERSSTSPEKMTVGDYLRAVESLRHFKTKTFLLYQNSLRTIVGECFGIRAGTEKFDYRSGGSASFAARIDRVRLARLTPHRIEQWKRSRTSTSTPKNEDSAKRSVNTYLRCARSLFGRTIQEELRRAGLPTPESPFRDVKMLRVEHRPYRSTMDPMAIVAAARNELRANDPAAWTVFLLALFTGLRRGEIDGLEWRMLDLSANLIRLERTQYLSLKTASSEEPVAIEAEVAAELRALKAASTSPFVVSSPWAAQKVEGRARYRCEPVFARIIGWLRNKGVTAQKPLHELRKELGAVMTSKHGIYAASAVLRHSDIYTTSRHYADLKTPVTSGLGGLLRTEIRPAAEG